MLLGLWEGVSEVMGWYTEVWIVAQNPKRRLMGFEHVVFLGGGECEGRGHSARESEGWSLDGNPMCRGCGKSSFLFHEGC